MTLKLLLLVTLASTASSAAETSENLISTHLASVRSEIGGAMLVREKFSEGQILKTCQRYDPANSYRCFSKFVDVLLQRAKFGEEGLTALESVGIELILRERTRAADESRRSGADFTAAGLDFNLNLLELAVDFTEKLQGLKNGLPAAKEKGEKILREGREFSIDAMTGNSIQYLRALMGKLKANPSLSSGKFPDHAARFKSLTARYDAALKKSAGLREDVTGEQIQAKWVELGKRL
ncbi:MAG: hypothetical protein ACXWP5_01345 [Bdellovibrionota bacterium]